MEILFFKNTDPRDSNLENLKEAEYDEFEVESDDQVLEIVLNNLIGPSTDTASTSSSISRTTKRVRLTVWQHFRRVEVPENEKSD